MFSRSLSRRSWALLSPALVLASAPLVMAAPQADMDAGDLARLMPEDSIFYAELDAPGERVGVLLQKLGLMGDGIQLGDRRLAISPLLVNELLGLSGAAVAVTSLNMAGGPPGGIAILDPGNLDIIRGLLETVVPAGGPSTEDIGGHPTYIIENQLWVTLTDQLVIAATSPNLISDALERQASGDKDSGLLGTDGLEKSLALRNGSLLYFCVNVEPIMPQIMMGLTMVASQDPGAAAVMDMLDPESTRALAGRISLTGEGIGVDLMLDLDEDHHNLAFDLLGMPSLSAETLSSVPAGAAAFIALSLNPVGEIPAGEPGRVSAMDLGRELFGNLAQVSAFALPMGDQGSPIPDVGLCLRVNNVERSSQLWGTLLSVASLASKGPAPAAIQVSGHEGTRFSMNGMPLFVLPHQSELIVATSQRALEAAVEAEHSGSGIMQDEGFSDLIAAMENGRTSLVGVHMGRMGSFVLPNLRGNDRDEAAAMFELLSGTTLSLGMNHGVSEFTISAALRGIPDLSGVLSELIAKRQGQGHQSVHGTLSVASNN
ncbi:MAG: hypothetical protein ACI9HE_001657 [Planctomycetota bacterium]|jgi:hypothetical protein